MKTEMFRLSVWSVLTLSLPCFAVPVALTSDATVAADVARTGGGAGFRVSVSFFPVTTLDVASNREMTETVAQFHAEEALSGYLKESKAISFSRVRSSQEPDGEARVKWTFAIPSEFVLDAPVEEREVREEKASGFSAGKGVDRKTLFLDFRSSCFKDLRTAETLFAEAVKNCTDETSRESLRKKMEASFDAMKKNIRRDDSLFRAEKADLLKKLDVVRTSLLAELSDKPAGADAGNSPDDRFVDASFVEPFGALLRLDPILPTSGGARIVERKDGSLAVLAVGRAMAASDDREKLAEMQAHVALSKLRGEEVWTEDELVRTVSRTTQNQTEQSESRTDRKSSVRMNSYDFQTGLDRVGTWLSSDGKWFFLAKGKLVQTKE